MRRQIRRKVGFHSYRSHSRSPTPVRNTESLVEIEMANVRAETSRTANSNLGIHIRAIHENLSAILVHNVAYLGDGLFEHSMGGRVSNHQAGKVSRMFLRFCD